jgi:hypothetical protein
MTSRNNNYTDASFLQKAARMKHYQLEYVLGKRDGDFHVLNDHKFTSGLIKNLSPASIIQLIESEILEKYQFVGLTERMDESLAVLDLIVMPSKVSGQALTADNNGISRPILKVDLTSAAKKYMDQDFERGNYDYPLYDLIDRILDQTVDMLSHKRVEEEVENIRPLSNIADEQCRSEVIYPCTEAGVRARRQSGCYHNDLGCGHECIYKELPQYINNEGC